MSSIFSTLHYYLVTHPTISTFTWSPPHTPLSSLPSLVLTLLLYLALSFLLLLRRNLFSLPSSTTLHLISSLHNSILLLLSLLMSISTILSSIHSFPSSSHFFCFPKQTPPSGPVFFWAYIFYLSKIYELIDTLLILLNPRKSLTFLHVYHHSVVLIMCYVWLQARQSLMPVALITNATVHVVMYAYYLCSSVGWRWSVRWKRVVTEVQIWQFVVSFGFSLVFLWMHFMGSGCEGLKGWVFNAFFNTSLLGLFLNFRDRSYERRRGKVEEKNGE